MQAKDFGTLYIVSTPIGNPGDLTLRALEVLKMADALICEERKEGAKFLKSVDIQKPIVELNEHNEAEMIQSILLRLMNGENLALISDCGTPVFNDPGRQLLDLLYSSKVPVIPVPGASSLMAAISVCPFNLGQFHFAGFLPPKTEQRAAVLAKLAASPNPVILMDTPYRLSKLLDEVSKAFGRQQQVFLAADLTMPSEKLLLGEVQAVAAQVQNRKLEFILIIDKPQRRRQA
ncbi:MAG: SAM-dependent methyltransferase [Anaerolineaceae bacterium]|nr:SAM-dependent methyltransferase [Anaerolineaceae bacterium]